MSKIIKYKKSIRKTNLSKIDNAISLKEIDDNIEQVWNLVSFFYESKMPMHFCFKGRKGIFKNGHITAMHERSKMFILNEFRDGEIIIRCNEVYAPSIQPYNSKKEEKEKSNDD